LKIRFTTEGKKQFLAVLAYIARNNLAAAQKFRETAEHALKRIERFPNSGRMIPDFPDLPYRELVVASYRFFYRLKENTLWVVGVWHGAQVPSEPMDL